MSFKNLALFFIIIIFTNNCSSKKEEIITKIPKDKIEVQMIKAYEAGLKAFDNQDYLEAAKKFTEAELYFPQSAWAPKAALMSAYSYFYDGYNNDSIYQLERFIKTYPNSNRIEYAHYLLAMSYYNKIVDAKRDITPLIQSKKKFQYVVKNFPNTEYALDSKFKLDLIEEMLASKEMFIAKHYLKKEKWIPAINRLKYIVTEHETTIYVEEALFRLVEIYYMLGLIDESKKYASVLGYNYQSSEWYEESYRILNKNYKNPQDKIKQQKKSKVLKKIKSILD
jgi:outer membrane protein assembly factor BamD